jgi:hypothetical protein
MRWLSIATISTARVRFPAVSRFLSPVQCTDRLWGPSYLVYNGYLGLFSPGIKGPGREVHHFQPSVRVKNGGVIPSLPRTSSWHKGLCPLFSRNSEKWRNCEIMHIAYRIPAYPYKNNHPSCTIETFLIDILDNYTKEIIWTFYFWVSPVLNYVSAMLWICIVEWRYSSAILNVDVGDCQISRPCLLTPSTHWLGGHQNRSGSCGENSFTAGNRLSYLESILIFKKVRNPVGKRWVVGIRYK